jgi:predicted DNA-binding protein (UPF0251 family)
MNDEELKAYRKKIAENLSKKQAAAIQEIKQAKARAKIDRAVKRRCGGG